MNSYWWYVIKFLDGSYFCAYKENICTCATIQFHVVLFILPSKLLTFWHLIKDKSLMVAFMIIQVEGGIDWEQYWYLKYMCAVLIIHTSLLVPKWKC